GVVAVGAGAQREGRAGEVPLVRDVDAAALPRLMRIRRPAQVDGDLGERSHRGDAAGEMRVSRDPGRDVVDLPSRSLLTFRTRWRLRGRRFVLLDLGGDASGLGAER